MNALRRLVQVLGELLITAGFLVLAFLAWQLWWTDVVANREQAGQVQVIERQFAQRGAAAKPGTTATPKPVAIGDALALIRIPRFGADYVKPVYEGTTADVLDGGVGHYESTVGPGAIGNFSLAGHRVTYGRPFNRIAELRPGDKVDIQTAEGHYVYVVKSHEIVTPDRGEVIAPVPGRPGAKPTQRWLTMTACHPQFSAAERYVVHALLLSGPGVK